MRSLSLLLVLALSTLIGGSPLPAVPAKCQRYTFCNGEMCDEICVIGTVETDPWTDSALSFQRGLQFNRSLTFYEMPGTHNGGMAQDYGMGIEEKFLKNLLIPVYGEEKSEVVIANQRHSLLDQLRMGVRHIEIDLYHFRRNGGIKICHWPVFPPDFTILVNYAARQQDLYPLDWEPTNMGCDEKKPFFEDILVEIRDWLVAPENTNEIIGLYIDNKNVAENHLEDFHEIVMRVFGNLLFTPQHKNTEYPTAWPTVAELVSKNRRVWIENNDDRWIGNPIADQHYFTPTIWQQFGPDRFAEYPACTVGNVDYYGKEMTRSLDGSLTLGPAFLWEGRTDYPIETIKAMTKCSINIQSMDQITPDTMQHFVWSWERNEPSSAFTRVQLTSSGRWKTADNNRSLPHACVSNSNESLWVLGSTAVWGAGVCPNGYSFGFPPSGLLTSKLATVANGAEVWLNYRV